MKIEEPWDMLSDKKIWSYLENIDNKMDPDVVRLMLIELFSRVKNLERDNYTLKVLLFESELVDEQLFKEARLAVSDYLQKQDEQKALDVEHFSTMGIPFTDWVQFVTKGKFSNADQY